MRKYLTIFFLCTGLFIVPMKAAADDFPLAGIDDVPSLGSFEIVFDKAFKDYVKENYGVELPRTFESPVLSDSNTKIGRSDQHEDGSDTDENVGAQVKEGVKVKDSDFEQVPPKDEKGFDEGPAGTKEVHTQILSLNMTDPGQSAHAVTLNEDKNSIGEVESRNQGGAFPAESFFNVFVKITVDLADPNIGLPGTMEVYNIAPLVIQNKKLDAFPPKVVYIHERSAQVALFDKETGMKIGKVSLAGHGVNLDYKNDADRKFFDDAMPVTFSQPFTATQSNGKVVHLTWATEYEKYMAGFAVYRGKRLNADEACTDNVDSYEEIVLVDWNNAQSSGFTETNHYLVLDPRGNSEACYGLLSVGFDGTFETQITAVSE